MQNLTSRTASQWHYPRRNRRLLTAIAAVLMLLSAVFLPGPNGLLAVLSRTTRLRRLQSEIPKLQARIDSLEQLCRYLADPAGATDYAAQKMCPRLNHTRGRQETSAPSAGLLHE